MIYSEAQNRATQKYKAKAYKRVPLDMKIEEYEKIKEYCDKHKMAVNTFIKELISKALKEEI